MTGALWGVVALITLVFGGLLAALRQGAKAEENATEAEAAKARVETLTEVSRHENAAAAQSDAELVARLTRKP